MRRRFPEVRSIRKQEYERWHRHRVRSYRCRLETLLSCDGDGKASRQEDADRYGRSPALDLIRKKRTQVVFERLTASGSMSKPVATSCSVEMSVRPKVFLASLTPPR